MSESEEIQAVLSQLGTLTDLITERVSMHDEMRELKVDIRSYVDDSRAWLEHGLEVSSLQRNKGELCPGCSYRL